MAYFRPISCGTECTYHSQIPSGQPCNNDSCSNSFITCRFGPSCRCTSTPSTQRIRFLLIWKSHSNVTHSRDAHIRSNVLLKSWVTQQISLSLSPDPLAASSSDFTVMPPPTAIPPTGPNPPPLAASSSNFAVMPPPTAIPLTPPCTDPPPSALHVIQQLLLGNPDEKLKFRSYSFLCDDQNAAKFMKIPEDDRLGWLCWTLKQEADSKRSQSSKKSKKN